MDVITQFTFENSNHISIQSSDSPDLIPNQAISLAELVRRFSQGQRLNVHSFPPNVFDGHDEELHDAPPSCDDIVDVYAYQQAHEEHKRDFRERVTNKQVETSSTEISAPPAE